jgi:hypothetical protein
MLNTPRTISPNPRPRRTNPSSVWRIWRAQGLAPHRASHFKLTSDPDFVLKLGDIVGLCVDPPDQAVLGRSHSPAAGHHHLA